MRILFRVFCLFLLAGLMSGCTSAKAASNSQVVATGGNVARGEQVIVQFKCGSCHTIPGIHNANGVFGPPLNQLARRSIIAGEFPNEPDFLVQWVKSPTSMKPATAMPDLGLSEKQARDTAAYLETLR
ncbi:MAG TPA: c-type cytochrome [Acidobacteriaceae bacterium]|nr:c-type cytochrome [Acidobacteriaceae bacterium]